MTLTILNQILAGLFFWALLPIWAQFTPVIDRYYQEMLTTGKFDEERCQIEMAALFE